jgi:hypothetical protein
MGFGGRVRVRNVILSLSKDTSLLEGSVDLMAIFPLTGPDFPPSLSGVGERINGLVPSALLRIETMILRKLYTQITALQVH